MTATPARPRATVAVLAAFAAVYLLWGFSFLGIKAVVETLPPPFFVAVRFLSAGFLLALVARGRPKARWSDPSVWIGGILLIFVSYALLGWAETRIPSGVAALTIATIPLWIVLIGALLPGGERLTLRAVLAVMLGAAGVGLLALPGGLRLGAALDTTGILVLIASSLTWAFGSLLLQRRAAEAHALGTYSRQMIVGGSLGLAFGVLQGQHPGIVLHMPAAGWVAMTYLILGATVVAYPAYQWLLVRVGPSRASTYAYVNPLIAVGVGSLAAGEGLTLRVAAAGVLILGATVLLLARRGAPSASRGARARPDRAQPEAHRSAYAAEGSPPGTPPPAAPARPAARPARRPTLEPPAT